MTVPKRGHWKWMAVAALSVGVLAAVLARKTERPAPSPEIRPAPVAKAPPEIPKPTPFPDRKAERELKATPEEQPEPQHETGTAERAGRAVWRVIAYTYTRRGDASQKIRQINNRWPEFKAELFSLNPGQPPYLVSIGGRMPREDALRLLRRARAAGLPADSYTQNFSH
jgi:hypothetical protein